jgi:ketosteroid isomerase-like protein
MGPDALADELIEHLRRYELPDHLLADGATHYLSFLDLEQPATETARMLALEAAVVARSELTVRRVTVAEDAVVLQLVSSGATRGGVAFRVPVCLVVSVEAGRITRLEEYADSAQVKPLLDEVLAR